MPRSDEPLKTEYEVVAHENTDGLRFLVVRTTYTVVADCRTRGAAEQVARDLAMRVLQIQRGSWWGWHEPHA